MSQYTPPPDTLTINKKTDHFFISINKQGPHSFVMLGLYEQNKVRNLLCRVGKFGNSDEDPSCLDKMEFLCNALFFAHGAHLEDEGISRKKKDRRSISYQAYDITYEQYLEFVRILESLQSPDNSFGCYKPETTSEDGDEVTLKWSEEIVFPDTRVDKRKKENLSELHINNTCRHSAIALVETTQHAPISSLVSSSFLMDLPYETILEHGKPSEKIPFYVLPPLPTAFHESDKAKEKVIMKLYSRMENMLLIEPKSQYTQNKFLKLKELYLDIVGPAKNCSLNELLKNIQNWKKDNEATLNVLRKEYFWDSLPFIKRQSSTMKLLSEVEDDLKNECANRVGKS